MELRLASPLDFQKLPNQMQYVPPPTDEQLSRVRDALGAASLGYSHRIEGGLSCAMDVLVDGSSRMVLRRYHPSYAERGEDAAAREIRTLELLQRTGIPAPAPIWHGTNGIFEEQAIIVSFVEGEPELTPRDPFHWAESLASTLAQIHAVKLTNEDLEVFRPGVGEDARRVEEAPETVLEHPLGEPLLRRRVLLQNQLIGQSPVFSHTDFWPGNTLWRDNELKAVIDWESPATGDREMDVAYCSLDIRYLAMDRVADRFVGAYREATGETLPNLAHWEAVALCRPMPDIAQWVPAWNAMGKTMTEDKARLEHTRVIEEFLLRTG
jgi:aminoglycoside phosphotransferase (APT) family kinase protein